MKNGLKIGDVSKSSGFSPDAIRYYEEFGLLKPKGRSQSGYRYYDSDALSKLVFIRNTQKLGFSLQEVKGLLYLGSDKRAKAGQVKNEIRNKLGQILQKQKNLNAITKVLKRMVASCERENAPVEQCPILKALQNFKLNQIERKILKQGGLL